MFAYFYDRGLFVMVKWRTKAHHADVTKLTDPWKVTKISHVPRG